MSAFLLVWCGGVVDCDISLFCIGSYYFCDGNGLSMVLVLVIYSVASLADSIGC